MKKIVIVAAICTLCFQPAFAADNAKSQDDNNIKLIKMERGKVEKQEKDLKQEKNKKTEENTNKEESSHSLQFGQVDDKQIYSLDNYAESVKISPASVEVITLKDIQRNKSPNIADTLKQYSGITLQDQGSVGGMTSASIRGISTVSVTLDGMRIDDPSFSSPFLNNLLKSGVERVEVVKGPQGTVHGNRSQGGLISMFTRQGQGPTKIEYDQSFGTYSTFQEDTSISGGNESYDYFFGLTRLDTNGGMKGFNDKVYRDDYGNLSVLSNIGKRLFAGKAELRNTFRYIGSRKELGVGWNSFDNNSYGRHKDIFENVSLSFAPVKWYDGDLKFGLYNYRDASVNPADTAGGSDSYFTTANTRFLFTTQHNLKYKNWDTLSFGYSMEHNDFNARDYETNVWDSATFAFIPQQIIAKKLEYTTNDSFINNTINYKDTIILKSGTRITSSPWGTYGTPNVSGAIVLPTPFFKNSYSKIRSSYGVAVNYPTPYQQAGFAMGYPIVSSGLKPEKLKGGDIGFEQSFSNDRLNFDFSYFNYDVKDKIAYDPNAFDSWWALVPANNRYLNLNQAKSDGIEVGTKLTLVKGLTARANYTYTNARDGNNNVLAAIPSNRWNFLVEYAPTSQKYSVYTRTVTSSSRIAGSQQLKGFCDTALGLTLRLFKFKDGSSIVAWGQMNNILNDRYELYPNYRSPGIRFLVGISFKYNLPDFKKETVNRQDFNKIAKSPF